jgi:hypothetical protein
MSKIKSIDALEILDFAWKSDDSSERDAGKWGDRCSQSALGGFYRKTRGCRTPRRGQGAATTEKAF